MRSPVVQSAATIRIIRQLSARLAGASVSDQQRPPESDTAGQEPAAMGGKQKAVLVTSFDENKVNSNWANLEVGERDIPEPKNGEVGPACIPCRLTRSFPVSCQHGAHTGCTVCSGMLAVAPASSVKLEASRLHEHRNIIVTASKTTCMKY